MPIKLYKEKSRLDWGCDENEPMTIEKINCGATLRIADAVEKMAGNYTRLQDDLEYWKQRALKAEGDKITIRRSRAALRGIIRRRKGGAA